MGRNVTQKIKEQLVVNFNIWNFDSDLGIETAANFLENIIDSTRNQTSVFVVLSAACHCECLSRGSLSIAHDSAIVAVDDRGDSFLSAVGKDVFLRSVVH